MNTHNLFLRHLTLKFQVLVRDRHKKCGVVKSTCIQYSLQTNNVLYNTVNYKMYLNTVSIVYIYYVIRRHESVFFNTFNWTFIELDVF